MRILANRAVYTVLAIATMVLTSFAGELEENKDSGAAKTRFEIPFEKYTLDNGLEVILHRDTSDPIVAMATLVHVGSNREKTGKTGFAHFFEHMSFNDSENVPRGSNRKMIEEWGGMRNGGTNRDSTVYYEVVPKDSLERLMWIDSDRLGFMINTVTETALENEKQVVKNEKRQRNDNQPYGHSGTVLAQTLFPEGHPYSWPVIGSLADLQAATLDDVKEFYNEFYGPNNATLVVAGDFEIDEVKQLIQKWFGEIKRGPEVPPLKPMPVTLNETRSVYHLDNFARVPQLQIVFPTVENYHEDSYALEALSRILTQGKRAPLYKVLVEEKKLAPSVSAYQYSGEVAGSFYLSVRANKDVALDDVKAAIEKGLMRFEKEGISDKDLARIKARQETDFYNGISSILNKAFSLANYNTFAGDPGYISTDIARIQAVTREDIMRVYNKYVKGKHSVMTSFVPKDNPKLILSGSTRAEVYEEPIVKGAEKNVQTLIGDYAKTPTKVDRSMPPQGPAPQIHLPKVWEKKGPNGIRILGVEHHEIPMVHFSLTIKGGHLLDEIGKAGVASLTGKLLNEGTALKTPEELEDAIGMLGSSVRVRPDDEEIIISGSTLSRNFDATLELAAEMLLQPRFDQAEFERLKAAAINQARQGAANPSQVGMRVFYRAMYGDNHIMSEPTSGTVASLEEITLDDVKAFYKKNFTPRLTSLLVAGSIKPDQVQKASKVLEKGWPTMADVKIPSYKQPEKPQSPKLYFVDIPGSKQSVLMVGTPTVAGGDEDFYGVDVAHNRLGGGSSARLTQLLRIEKGYTYGAFTFMARRSGLTPFAASTSVRANVTLESLKLLREQLQNYSNTFTEDDLATTKVILTKRNASAFETTRDLIRNLETINQFNLPLDVASRNQATLQGMTLDGVRKMIDTYLNEKNMIYVVVGDGQTQLSELSQLGYGEPIVLDREGHPVK